MSLSDWADYLDSYILSSAEYIGAKTKASLEEIGKRLRGAGGESTQPTATCACCTEIIKDLVRALLDADEALHIVDNYPKSHIYQEIKEVLSEHEDLIYSIVNEPQEGE